MLLRDSEVAKTVRSYLLNVEESVDTNTKEWAIEREVSKKLRKQLTSTLERTGEVTRMKGNFDKNIKYFGRLNIFSQ